MLWKCTGSLKRISPIFNYKTYYVSQIRDNLEDETQLNGLNNVQGCCELFRFLLQFQR